MAMIRRAIEADFPYVYELIMMASSLVFEDALKTKDVDKIKNLVHKFYFDDNTKFSCANIYVYEVDNKVAGCIVYYDSRNEELYNQVMESYLENDYKFAVEAMEDSVYLDTVSVFEKFRGKSISRKLIEFMIEDSNKAISLIAESHKEFVIDYYKRLGFREISEITMYNKTVKTMLYSEM